MRITMLKKLSPLSLLLLPIMASASDFTLADQSKKLDLAAEYMAANKPIQACQAYADAEEMGYLGDPNKMTDPTHNYIYTTAALAFAKCLDEQPAFAKKYDIDEVNSIIVYTTLNDMYHNKAAQAALDREMAILAKTASNFAKLNNKEIINGSKAASLSCVAAHTAYNLIGFTGQPSERKNPKINTNYVSTGMVLALCNVYHPYYTKSSSRLNALKEANTILSDLANDYGNNKAKKMLQQVSTMLAEEKAKTGGQ